MTTTKIPACVTFGARDVPYGEACFHGQAVALAHRGDRPCIARLVGATFDFGVTINGLTEGLVREHVEPFGRVTISPSEDGSGFQWVVVDVDHDDGTNAQVWLPADKVGGFLVDAALAQILPVPDVEMPEWLQVRPHRDGGAL